MIIVFVELEMSLWPDCGLVVVEMVAFITFIMRAVHLSSID